jgi:hypothetical protein
VVERGAAKVARLELLPLKAYVTFDKFKLITSFLQLLAVMGFFSVVKWAVLGSGHLYIQFHTFAVLGLAFGGVVAVSIGYLSGLVACRVSNRALSWIYVHGAVYHRRLCVAWPIRPP